MEHRLYTIGYEGTDIDTFIWHLKKYSVSCLLDVRGTPASRKPGFSKRALSERLEADGIRYVHFGELGSPKDIRDKVKTDGDYASFFAAMEDVLAGRDDVVETAYRHISDTTSCLMCFERKAEHCHRSIVAKKIVEKDGNGLKIENL